MTAVCTTPPPRPTFDICPPWCAGHEDSYQSWEQFYDGTIRRYHGERGTSIGGVVVTVGVEEVLDEGLRAPLVELTLEGIDVVNIDLTDGDAHELGMAIVGAADRARRFRLEQEAGR